MKKFGLTVLLGAVFSFIVLLGAVQAADKMAFVDLSRIFAEYNKTKDYDKVLGDKETTYNSEREKKIEDVKKFQEKMNLLSEKQKEKKKKELESKIKDLQDYDRQKTMDLRKDQDEKMKEILKDIEEAVRKYAEKEGCSLVFNDRVLIYQSKSLDITSDIIKILNKDYRK